MRPSQRAGRRRGNCRVNGVFTLAGRRRCVAGTSVCAIEHRALLEPIEEDEHSEYSDLPLTREMPPGHLYGEGIVAFGLSWCNV
jgi:hypothetical protein